jgi:ribosomal protein S17E
MSIRQTIYKLWGDRVALERYINSLSEADYKTAKKILHELAGAK